MEEDRLGDNVFKKKLLIISTVALALCLSLAGGYYHLKNKRDSASESSKSNAELINLDFEALKESGVVVEKAKKMEVGNYLNLLGRVVLNPEKSSKINPRYPGVVRKTFKSAGDLVKKGEILARVESNVGMQAYTLRAATSGMIVEKRISVGEFVNVDREAFTIADISSLWVNISIPQRDLAKLSVGQEVVVNKRSTKDRIKGKLFFVPPFVEVHTRTADATLEIENPDKEWRPGQLVDGFVKLGTFSSPVVVKKDAVFWVDDRPYVHVLEKNKLSRRYIKPGRRDFELVEVLEGLNPGETYVVDGYRSLRKEIARNLKLLKKSKAAKKG